MDTETVFLLDPYLHYVPRDEQHLFINSELPDWLLVNTNGAILLSMFDGVRRLQDIIELTQNQGFPTSLVYSMISRARDHGILTTTKRPSPSGASRNPRHLETLLVKVTNRCNLRCDYCYADSGIGESLSSEDMERLLDDVNRRFGPIRIELSGGEPLLHRNTLPFAKTAKSYGHKIALLTNGIIISEHNVDEISENFDLVQVSMDGADPAGHDCHRGVGSHAKATRAVDLLIERGANVQIGMTLNYGSMSSITEMITKYGKRLKIKPMSPIGRGAQQIGALPPDAFYQAVEPYFNSEAAGNPRRETATFVQSHRRAGASKCAIGDMHISVTETGDVFPCHLINNRRYLAGNIHHRSLAEIYDYSPVLLDLERFSVDSMTPCSTCAVKRLCGGGCPAVALAETDRLDVAPSFCAHEKARFIDAIFDIEDGLSELVTENRQETPLISRKHSPIFMKIVS